MEQTREELIAGLQRALGLLSQNADIWRRKEALRAKLTPPKPLLPLRQPLAGSAMAKMWVFTGLAMFLIVLPFAYVSTVYDTASGSLNVSSAARTVLFCLIGWIVCLLVGRHLWNKLIEKKNADIGETNREIARQNTLPHPKDAPIYAELDALAQQEELLRRQWSADVAPWYPSDYATVQAAQELLHLVQNHRANTMTEAVNVYETMLHQRRMEMSQQQLVQQQEEMRRSQGMQSGLLGVTAVATTVSAVTGVANVMQHRR